MDEFNRIKAICKSTLETFCASEECDSPLDEFEVEILSDALAQSLTNDLK